MTLNRIVLCILVLALAACATNPGASSASGIAFDMTKMDILDPALAGMARPGVQVIYTPGGVVPAGINLSGVTDVRILTFADAESGLAQSYYFGVYAPRSAAAEIAVTEANAVSNLNASARVSAFVVDSSNIAPVYFADGNGVVEIYDTAAQEWPISSTVQIPEDLRVTTPSIITPLQDANELVIQTTTTVIPVPGKPFTLTFDYQTPELSLDRIRVALQTIPDADLVFIVESSEKGQALVQLINTDEEFMAFAATRAYSGNIRILIANGATGEITDSVIVHTAQWASQPLLWNLETVQIPQYSSGFSSRTILGRYEMPGRTGFQTQLILTNATAEEVAAYRIQFALMGKSPTSVIQVGNNLIMDNLGGKRFIYKQVESTGWYGFDSALAQAQAITKELARQGYIIPDEQLFYRIMVSSDNRVWMDLAGIQKTSLSANEAMAGVEAAWAKQFDAYMSGMSEGVTLAHTHLFSALPDTLPSKLPAPIAIIGPELEVGVTDTVLVTNAEAAASQILTKVGAAQSPDLYTKLSRALSPYIGTAVKVFNYGMVFVVINMAGYELFQWGPNIEVPVVYNDTTMDASTKEVIQVNALFSDGTSMEGSAPWLVMQSDDSHPEALPSLMDIWNNEATPQIQMNTQPAGLLYLGLPQVVTMPSSDKTVSVVWIAEGSVNNPSSITLAASAKALVRFEWKSDGSTFRWIRVSESPYVDIPLDTSMFPGTSCFERVIVDEDLKGTIHFSHYCK